MNDQRQDASVARPVKILLTDTNRWALSSRLAIALNEAGCSVAVLCPTPGHAALKTHAIERVFHYSSLRPLMSLSASIETIDPDILIPCCDRSVEHIHELYARCRARGAEGQKIASLIERSLGPESSHSIVSSRYRLLMMARGEGIRVPRTDGIASIEALTSWHSQEPLPWVLKADGTWGGGGVRIVQSREKVEQLFLQLLQMFRVAKALKRLVVNRDAFWLRPLWHRRERSVIAQSYIHGRPGNCVCFCWNGKLLGIISVEVVRCEGLTGPASVVRVVEHPDMRFAAERIAERLHLSGFFGLDFMIEEGTDIAYLIEMNPRSAPPGHLRLGEGRDLVGAVYSQLSGAPPAAAGPVTTNDLIAYFPQAMNADDDLIKQCYQDVPNGEPELIQELIDPFPDRTLLFRLVQRIFYSTVSVKSSDFVKNAAS